MKKNPLALKNLYLLTFIFCLIVFSIAKFPKQELKNRLISEIENNGVLPVTINEVDFKMPLKLRLNKVNLIMKNSNRVEIDSLTINPSVFSLVFSKDIKIPFDAYLYGGDIKGDIFYSKDKKRIKGFKADIHSIDASPLPHFINVSSKLNLDGELDGYIKYESNKSEKEEKPSVFYSFTSDNLSVKNFQIEKVSFNEEYKDLKLELKGSIENKLTTIENLSFKNEDFDLSFSGKMPPPWNFKKGGRLDLAMNLNVYSNKAKLALLKAFLSPNTDGSHSGKILGTVSSPKLVNGTKKSSSGI